MSEKGRGDISSPNKFIANLHKLTNIYENFAMKNSKMREGGEVTGRLDFFQKKSILMSRNVPYQKISRILMIGLLQRQMTAGKTYFSLPNYDKVDHLLPTGWKMSVSRFTLTFPV